MSKTTIEWTDRSINPIRTRDLARRAVGHYCEKISSGCAHCYASRYQPRVHMPTFPGANRKFPKLPILDDEGRAIIDEHLRCFLDEKRMREPLNRREPTKYFWCDMTDLFGSWVPDEWLDRCFATMGRARRHTHQVLTKRIERAVEYFGWHDFNNPVGDVDRIDRISSAAGYEYGRGALFLPLPNVWLGTSVENRAVLHRIDSLRECPAAVRFLSIEPLLEDLGEIDLSGIDWVIVGGESGAGWRPMEVEWVRAIRHQCVSAGVAFFFKQWAGLRPKDDPRGRKLDGREWNQFPEPAVVAGV